MKKFALFISIVLFVFACGGSEKQKPSMATNTSKKKVETTSDNPKGIGPVTEVQLNSPLDASMIAAGKKIYEVKCAACHKLSDKRVVGPGWMGVTERRKPEWIMNMVMNVEEMLEKDKEARAQLKECLVRMPNQNLTEEDSRSVLEFMYKNDEKE